MIQKDPHPLWISFGNVSVCGTERDDRAMPRDHDGVSVHNQSNADGPFSISPVIGRSAPRMQVQNWMSAEVATVEEETTVIRVMEILEKKGIRHLPVLKDGRLVGMITDGEVKDATPMKGTTLKAEELYFFLAEMKARDIMRPNPLTIRPDQTMEVAAVKMLEHQVTGIPVVTAAGELVGIISQGDVFRVLISITGIYERGIQFAFNLEDRSGSIREVTSMIRDRGGSIVSVLSTSATAEKGFRHVFIRIKWIPKRKRNIMTERLRKAFALLYVVEDPSV
jgi:acetoin utilization protein AcuB